MIKELLRTNLPDPILIPLTLAHSALHPHRSATAIYPTAGGWQTKSRKESFHFPTARTGCIAPMGHGYGENLYQKYTQDVVDVAPGDVVVDVGAFVGGFSIAAARRNASVYGCEPSPRNFRSLIRNTHGYNVTPILTALWHTEVPIELNVGNDPTDHSLIEPDEGKITEYVVPGTRLDSLMEQQGEERIDFLKIDAEGVEPEVLSGAEDIEVGRVAVDCTAERDGESSKEAVSDILRGWGKEVQSKDDIVFGF